MRHPFCAKTPQRSGKGCLRCAHQIFHGLHRVLSGNTEAATENVLFYDGRIHKLSEVRFEIPMDEDGFEDFMKPWVFTSDDNRFYMNFTPVLDRSAFMSAGVVLSDQHQVFGRFTGRITLDDGTVLPVRDFFGFAEKVENKW